MFFEAYPSERLTLWRAFSRWRGVGLYRASVLLLRTRLGLRKSARLKKTAKLKRISRVLRKINFCLRDKWRLAQKKHIQYLKETRLIRILRSEKGLPVRGQKTKNNHRTTRKKLNF
uniref:Ribosomal protein S13 n=2 Tax=Chromera velia TaxID=505693 RepID=D9IXK5_9ALVE|nr:ribosomal protein S13 [Chromera velia]ADJ66533.2 ribosomal protein S13 [Chromera velia]